MVGSPDVAMSFARSTTLWVSRAANSSQDAALAAARSPLCTASRNLSVAAMTATTSASFWPWVASVVSTAVVVGTGSEVIGSVVCGAVVTLEVAGAVVGSSTELVVDGKGLGASPAVEVFAAEMAALLGLPAVPSPESRVRMIAVAPPTTTSTAKIASRTLRVVLLGGGSSTGGPKVGGGPPGGGWVGEFCAG